MKKAKTFCQIIVVYFIAFMSLLISSAFAVETGLEKSQKPDTALSSAYDVDQLKQSDWWSKVQKNIRDSEYHISSSESKDNSSTLYQAPNRAQNIRTHFLSDSVIIIPRQGAPPPVFY